jgi:phosphatidylglycerol lysyltransferase
VVPLLICAAYFAASILHRKPMRIVGFEIGFPAPTLVVAQFALSTLDWALAAGVFWILLASPRPAFLQTAGTFVLAQVAGLITQVPAGLGVFEWMVAALKLSQPKPALLAAFLVYRLIYYVLPLVGALAVLMVDAAYHRRHLAQRWGRSVVGLTISLAPKLLAGFTFIAGAVLIFSGATPEITSRLAGLAQLVPDPVVALSHFIGSLVGLLLLLVSQALARRANAAWTVTVGLLVVGMAASLLKGFDYEEATVLALLLALLLAARAEFDRRSALFTYPFSRKWFTAVTLVVMASVVLSLFAFRHEHAQELWWRFALFSDASRFLRATVGVAIVLLAVGLRQLLRPDAPPLPLPTDADIEAMGTVIAKQRTASAYLGYLRDKALLWNEDRTAFLMYAVQGRTWVALHDPVGPPSAVPGLIRRFLELVDDSDGVPVFYEVRKDYLYRYADFGLAFAKTGEEALVPLPAFSLDGGSRKKMRLIYHRLAKEGATLRIIPAAEVAAILPALREVSDAWLAAKGTAEKGFSLGFFDKEYLPRFPVVTLEVNGTIEAFATLWPGPHKIELSVDLMRFRPTAPKSAIEGLLIYVMLWGKTEGYQWFNLGMAPLSGLESTARAPLWVKIATYLYRYGELFYNFQGLRGYKDKFDPVWESIYIAYPGGLSLPNVLLDVSALIAGGYHGILLKRGR